MRALALLRWDLGWKEFHYMMQAFDSYFFVFLPSVLNFDNFSFISTGET